MCDSIFMLFLDVDAKAPAQRRRTAEIKIQTLIHGGLGGGPDIRRPMMHEENPELLKLVR